jgi:hypothetical protein
VSGFMVFEVYFHLGLSALVVVRCISCFITDCDGAASRTLKDV